jgi:cation transport ATPase
LTNDPLLVPWSIGLARRARRTILENLFWAFSYNAVGIALAAAGWLNPAFAAAAMVGSSLMVVTNSLRLARLAPAEVALPGPVDIPPPAEVPAHIELASAAP